MEHWALRNSRLHTVSTLRILYPDSTCQSSIRRHLKMLRIDHYFDPSPADHRVAPASRQAHMKSKNGADSASVTKQSY
jgi:hypothetical protein